MRKFCSALLLLATLPGAAQACSCIPPGEDEAANVREQWKHSQAIVIAEVVGQSSEASTSWLSRDHVLGRSSPWRRRQMLHLVVRHHWKGELTEGTNFVVDQVDGAMCGYESWQKSRTHLLYLSKSRHWVAGLCGPSHPVFDAANAIKQQDEAFARYLDAAQLPARR